MDPVAALIKELDESYWDLRRERTALEPKSAYSAGETSRTNPVPRGVDPLGTDADYHYATERNYFLHVERGRAAVRNHPLVEQGINRVIANLRLDDIALDVDSGDAAADQDIKDAWRTWCGETQGGRNLCDYEGSRSLQQIARQSFFNRCSDGDIVHLPTTDGSLQTWESHHIRTPFEYRRSNNDQDGIIHGAEVRSGQTVAYWVTPLNVAATGTLTRRGQARRYPVFDADGNKVTFWMGFRHRFYQRRGISRLSPPRDAMTGFQDLNFAHIKSSLRRALISYIMQSQATTPAPPGGSSGQIPQTGDRYTLPGGLGVQSHTIEQMGEAAVVMKPPSGYSLQGWNANLPPDSWFEHSALLLTMLAVNLDLPLSFLLLDGSMVNFHGGRMTFDQVKLRMRQIQKDEIQGFWRPTFEWWWRLHTTPGSSLFRPEWVRFGKVKATFRPQGWPYVKPAEDVAAEREAEAKNLKSRRCILAERGYDIDEVDPEIVSDRSNLIRLTLTEARKIRNEFPEAGEVADIARELRYGLEVSGLPPTSAADLAAKEEDRAAAAAQPKPQGAAA
jgi:capsid protein